MRLHSTRPLRTLAAMVLAAAGLGLAGATPADAAVQRDVRPAGAHALVSDACGSDCDDENPNTYFVKLPGGPSNWYRCNADAYTVEQIGPNENSTLRYFGVTLQLRYSPRCRTVWSRAFGLQRSDTLWVKRNPGTSYQDDSIDVEYPYNSDFVGGTGYMWSVMLNDAGQKSVACFTARSHRRTGPGVVCTPTPF